MLGRFSLNITSIIFIKMFVSSFSGLAGGEMNNYHITIDESNPLRVHVSSELLIQGDTLYMSTNCPNYDYPEGWSTFIKNLQITTPDGRAVLFEYISKSKWLIKRNISDMLFLNYDVDLSFIKEKWDVGNEQAGFTDSAAVYLVSKALFIFSKRDVASEISFNLPKDWKLATPWPHKDGRSFSVDNNESLIENSIVYGDFYMTKYTEDVFQFSVALLGVAKEDSELFSSTLKKIIKAYLKIFSQTPPTNYLITMFYNDIDDGESFYESFAMTLKNPINETNKIVWANQIAHELFHYWNSDLIRASSYSDRQWFSEGTAEYYANLTLVRQGIISESDFLSKAEKILGLYQNYRGWRETETSLLEAGKNKGLHRFLVYNGGWAVAMALDVEIMENTKGHKNLDDFMALMFARYRSNSYSYDNLVNTASEVCGVDLGPFFEKYVEGNELLPLNNYMKKLGYQMNDVIYEAEIYLVRDSVEELNLNQRWLRYYRYK